MFRFGVFVSNSLEIGLCLDVCSSYVVGVLVIHE